MSKLKKKKSQVSRDFEESLNVAIRVGFLSFSEENERNSNSSANFPVFNKRSISNTLKDDLGRTSFQTLNSNKSSSLSTENSFEIINMNCTAAPKENKISKKNKKKSSDNNAKIPFFIKSIFSNSYEFRIPFETTSISNLSFPLNIVTSNEEKFLISVRKYYTIDKLITIISKKRLLKYDEISLYHNDNRLEKHITLSSYGITVKSNVQLKILEKIEIVIIFLTKQYSLSIYTSKTVEYLKTVISKKVNIKPDFMNLKFNDVILQDNKELFLYGIENGSWISIWKLISKESEINLPNKDSPGLEIAQQYIHMANALETCDCRSKRINAITMGIFAVLNRTLKDLDKKIFQNFDKNLHLSTCFKNKIRCSSYSTVSGNSQSFESETSDMSSKEVSLNDCITAEIDRVENNKKLVIEESDLEFLCNVRNFKEFKHFLKIKLGKECTLRSVSMLYKYGMELVAHIGCDEEDNPYVKRMLQYIKEFFHKYYEKDIINKGGLVALTLTGSDIDD